MKFILLSLFCISVFTFCTNSKENAEMNAYFEKEIKNRREILDKLSLQNDSLNISTLAIHQQVNDYILLSKDVENISAAVNTANAYFLNMANSYGINYADFTKITRDMSLDEIAIILKQNELNLFNQLIFKSNPTELPPFTAQ